MIKSLFKRQCLGNKQRFHSFSSFDEFVKLAKLASLVLKHNDSAKKKHILLWIFQNPAMEL